MWKNALEAIRELMAFQGQRFRKQLNCNSSFGTKPVHQKHNLNSDPLGLAFRECLQNVMVCTLLLSYLNQLSTV